LTVGEIPPAVLNDTLRDIETDAQNHIQKALDRVQQAGIQGEGVIVEGLPFQTIIDIAKDKHVDVIVMGTHGRAGLSHILMGSVAEKVVRLAPCSVLVTRDTIEDAET